MAQQKLYEAEAEVEAKNWEKRNSDVAFQEIDQEFEAQKRYLNDPLLNKAYPSQSSIIQRILRDGAWYY